MMKNQRGFTLIEVMITMAILATLTLMTAQSINQAIKAKAKLQDQMDDVSRMRDGLRLVERDVNLAFHYRDVEKELENLVKKKNQGQNQNNQNQNFQNPPGFNQGFNNNAQQVERREAPRRDPETHFVGAADNINFPTMNNARTVRNTQQADFIEVGYSVKDCKSVGENGGTSKCLWRRSSPYVDLDITKGGDEIVLLENVSEFKLRYMGKGKQDWVSDWRSDSQGDGATKGKFPQAVEVSLTIEKKVKDKSKKYSMQLIVPIHFPNNPEEGANGQQQQNPGAWPQPSGPSI